jgi:energy-coupling factor transporter ATP-binding protein EcfA2
MSEPQSPDLPRRLLTDLCHLVSERAAVERQVHADFAQGNETAENEYREAERLLTEDYHARKAAIEQEFASARTTTEAKFQSEHESLERAYEAAREKIAAQFAADQQAAEQAQQDAHWEAIEASEAARGGMNIPLKEVLAGLESRWQQLEQIHQQAVDLLRERGHWDDVPETPPVAVLLEKHPGRRFYHALELAQSQLRDLQKRHFWSRLHQGFWPVGIFLLVCGLTVVPAGFILGWNDWPFAAVSGGTAAIVSIVVALWSHHVAKKRSIDKYLALRQTMLETGLGHATVLETAKIDCERLDATIHARHKAQSRKADKDFASATARIEKRRQIDQERADSEFPRRMAELSAWRDQMLQRIEEKYPPLLRRIEEHYASESERIRVRHDTALEENRRQFERRWNEMAERWHSGIERFRASVSQSDQVSLDCFPNWNSDDWDRWTQPAAIPPAVPIGRSRVKLADVPDGVPEDERLRPAQTEFTLPIMLPFPQKSLLLLKAGGAGRSRAVDFLQSSMLRLLTAMPPGKVRFTIIDPVGLGDNFSAFMHLADFDEQLVASRIWTDSAHIEQRLADLTKHMENVIQVYLRQEFHSIEEYNASAGEMAEPYRVLVVANFPTNFSEAAVNRMKSVIASGARCGVFVMMSIDTNTPVPRNCQLPDLESEGLALRWNDGNFVWSHPDFGPLAVQFENPPPVERFKEIVRTVGATAKDSGRVEVPFSHIVPPENEWWATDSRGGIDVPLGRAGAMKLQHLDLGHGTSQHVLISGKTGSGKSTLLHVLITNLALRYSPEEVELYLVDFKKGVEFKAYARSLLPHARVVAIESEREFGLSVLQRLDAELRTRGDMFRKRGTQDVKAYRAIVPDAKLPRILLIIDEFQELFVEDDRIAAESALLLDRLVRQGRAFGIHVLLGSQTLGGAYTLARSTIGQMAVRIALQCSEADAHLILSEDNTAARLLTRPGEAIYNDANGLYEGNHPFQIVWLDDHQRDDYLRQISQLARQRHLAPPPLIVFEGNVLADLADNPILRELIESRQWPEKSPVVPAWLGSAVAIKDPTNAVFLRQNGSNVLMVGHREEAALGVLAGCFISLAAQLAPSENGAASPLALGERQGESAASSGQSAVGSRQFDAPLPNPQSPIPNPSPAASTPNPLPRSARTGATFYILDGMRSDAPEFGFWKRLAEAVPQTVKIAGVREAPEVMAEIAADLAARQQAGHDNSPPVYLLLYNLGRFRDLRREDDFGFSGSDDQTANPAKQFTTILREGPPLGIHTAIWCDTYSNVTRMLDRQSLQDFEMRILFQMNGNDSSSLMDSPEASRLGVHRAILYDEGQGLIEKFRPYGLPSAEYLAWVKQHLHGR